MKKDNLTDGNGNVIDVGSYAVSAFENLTGDSNLDLILGSYDGTLRVYENTTSGWEFKGYIRDVNNNIIDVGTHSAPAFGWVIYKTDGEHRADRRDLIIGCADGTIWCYESTVHLYENTMYNWKYRGKLAADGREIDVGNYSKPVLADLTGDTKNDLIVGAGDGSLHFYKCENTQNAEFYEDTTVYERVNDEYSDDYDYAAPTVADLDRNSLLPLDLLNDTIVGWGDGHIHIYKNVGTPSAPRWDVWPIAPTEIPTENYLRERNLSVLQKYLDLILDAENEYVDEIAFSIAHTSVDVLTNEDVYVEVFKKNAELIYEIDKYLQYADVVESGDYTVATPPANGYALLIGIEDYPETGNDLDYCLDDVYDMREALINFCNFSGSNIRILADTNANKSNIQNAINWLAANADSNDIVMFFYSGHGMSSGKLAQYDYSTQGGITSAELDSWLDNVTSTNIIIVLDCCFAGAFTSKNVKCIFENTKEWSNFFRGIAQEGRIICAACDENEYSWEFDELRNGAFSYYLTQALQSLKSDVNKNDWVSIEEAFNRAKPRVSNYVLTNTQERQIPQIYDGISGEVELVFFYPTGDYWTTIEYNISIGGVNETYELPRDIYYWYVVHPKITDEIPTFIDPDTEAPAKPPRGKFWREYLFFYADESYPPHPATDADGDGKPDFYYPKDAKPPLLKEKIANITILYDGVPYNAPSGYDDDGYLRDPDPNGNRRRSWKWSYEKNHAIEIVSNWVAKTLPLREQESNDDERPIQPVRIAHHHNGNCGELQDLTAAAARTCLIPASGICLIGEDHVWNEFYYDDAWHQWDNYWSDGGSVIDNFENYWVGWGRRGGSGIFRWNGDDSIEDVTSSYVPTAPYWTYTEAGSVYVPAAPLVKVVVNDSDGNPVDGALVVFSSYWLADHSIESIVGMSFGFVHYIPGAAIPSIWNFTDWNGIAEFRLVGDFSISVYSKLGSDTESSVTIKEVSDYETGNYTYEFKLQDTMPYPAYNKGSDKELMGDYYRADVSYSVLGEQYQKYTIRWPPTGPVYIGYYFEHFEKVDTSVDCFMTDQINARRYLQGLQFNYNRTWSTENVYGAEFSNVPLDDNNSILFSNIDSVETTKLVAVTIVLYRNQTPFELSLDIEKKPLELALSGKANYSFIKDVRVRLDYEDWLKANYYRPPDKNYWLWNYSLNLTQYYLGKHIIS
ncbi:MAG: caspase family protein, partial [Candidatus Thermoplasmatota archaeon]